MPRYNVTKVEANGFTIWRLSFYGVDDCEMGALATYAEQIGPCSFEMSGEAAVIITMDPFVYLYAEKYALDKGWTHI